MSAPQGRGGCPSLLYGICGRKGDGAHSCFCWVQEKENQAVLGVCVIKLGGPGELGEQDSPIRDREGGVAGNCWLGVLGTPAERTARVHSQKSAKG